MIPQDSLVNQQLRKMGRAQTSGMFWMNKKIVEEARYDGLYAVCTDLFEDDPGEILKVSERRWQIETCFRIMKTDFPQDLYMYKRRPHQGPLSHLFLALLVYRCLENKLNKRGTAVKSFLP